jgi:hypothetical protein
MPAAAVGRPYRVSEALVARIGDTDLAGRLKNHARSLLAPTLSWAGTVRRSSQPGLAADGRASTMVRRVQFDYSPETEGEYVEFVVAEEDDCDISW